MTDSITISTELLVAVAKWATSDETRMHLASVAFIDGHIVGCDGHRLVRVPVAKLSTFRHVPRDVVFAAAAAQKALRVTGSTPHDSDGRVAIEISWPTSGTVALKLGSSTLTAPAPNIDYPPIDKVIPDPTPDAGEPTGYIFNPKYLEAMRDVVSALDGEGRGVELVSWGRTGRGEDRLGDAVRFEGPAGSTFVIMPMRCA